jgi:hypothetical protein
MIQEEGQNLIFILSLPRSGSTLLGAILGNHPKVSCPPEPWFLLRLAEVYGNPCFMKKYDDLYASLGTKSFMPAETFFESARAFAISAYNHHLREKHKEVFVGKTPRYYHILDFIEQLFPKAVKIWLKRDPLDVAASYKSTWSIGMDCITGKKLEPHSFDFIIGLHALGTFFDEASPYKFTVKYEDIASNPRETIERLCDFCSLTFDEAMIHYGTNDQLVESLENAALGDKRLLRHKSVHGKSVGKWRVTLSENEISDLISVIGGDIFIRMGYEPTLREVVDKYRIEKLPSASALTEIRAELTELYNTGVLFSWERKRIESIFKAPKAKYIQATSERDALAAQRDEILKSLSWKITAPLRYAGGRVKKLTKKRKK